jgi:hypothetical protein
MEITSQQETTGFAISPPIVPVPTKCGRGCLQGDGADGPAARRDGQIVPESEGGTAVVAVRAEEAIRREPFLGEHPSRGHCFFMEAGWTPKGRMLIGG